jgi:hypothetical protein
MHYFFNHSLGQCGRHLAAVFAGTAKIARRIDGSFDMGGVNQDRSVGYAAQSQVELAAWVKAGYAGDNWLIGGGAAHPGAGRFAGGDERNSRHNAVI